MAKPIGAKQMTDINSRMEDLVRRLAAVRERHPGNFNAIDEAREIVAELDGPKSDEEWAFKICKDWYPEMSEGYKGRRMGIAKACIAKGRELALGDAIAQRQADGIAPSVGISDKWDDLRIDSVTIKNVAGVEDGIYRKIEETTCDHDWHVVTKFGEDNPYDYLCSKCRAKM